MLRIVVTGNRGCGKSTLALRLSEVIGIQVYHVDDLFFDESWNPINKSDRLKSIESITNKSRWIIEGHGDYLCSDLTYEARLNKADTLIMLDYSTITVLYRALKRKFGFTERPDFRGRKEQYRRGFWLRLVKFNQNERNRILEIASQFEPQLEIFLFKTPEEASKWFTELKEKMNDVTDTRSWS